MGDVIDFQRERNLRVVKKRLQALLSGHDGRPYREALRGEVHGKVRKFLTEHHGVPVPWNIVDLATAEDQRLGVIRMTVMWLRETMQLELTTRQVR